MKHITIYTLIGTFLFILSWGLSSHAEISSQSYIIPAYVLNGGGLQSASENFHQVVSLGESTPMGFSQSENFKNYAGFIPQITILPTIPVICNAIRSSPVYTPGGLVIITIEVNPNTSTGTYAVEETPPDGWPVSNINEGGTWDGVNQKVKWGPFIDNTSRTLTYNLEAPFDANGCYPIYGTASFDGFDQSICGDVEICEGLSHPADTSSDWLLAISELTGYGAAWKRGDEWPVGPNPIPISYVTRAGYIWKGGEIYHYIPDRSPPLCWDLVTTQPLARRREMSDTQTLNHSFDPNSYMPGQPVTVIIEVTPAQSTMAYALEDMPPNGWLVDQGSINENGDWDNVNKKVKWGPFFDNQQRISTYNITPPPDESGTKIFHGVFSANGIDFNIDSKISAYPDYGVMELSAGWSMISLPIIPDNATLSAVFPGAVVMYMYEKGFGYVRVEGDDNLKVGRGYLILLKNAQNYRIDGQPIPKYTLPVNENGWEMIGGCSSPAQALADNCNIGVICRYIKGVGYQRIQEGDLLEPCLGYWILFSNTNGQSVLRVTTQF